jgi:hypothetical protein
MEGFLYFCKGPISAAFLLDEDDGWVLERGRWRRSVILHVLYVSLLCWRLFTSQPREPSGNQPFWNMTEPSSDVLSLSL